ncbi:MAG: PQQ-like beta-propeller repeat protein [Planctomycetota bacterium]|nr:PQQ-like beta-propeller repeat protein [Planctomycetota bacterium]
MRVTSGLLAVLCFLMAAALPAADWPRFRGPDGSGMSPETGINKDWKAKPPKELWKIALGDRGFAGPSVAAGKLFIMDHKGSEDVVRAVDVASGKDVWTFPYPDVAKDNYGFARATPTCDKGMLYTCSRLGVIHCLDAEKGTKVWMRDMRKEMRGKSGAWDYAGSVLIDGDRAVVVPGGSSGAVAVLDKATGKTIWQGGGDDEAGYSTPVAATIGGHKQYIIFTGVSVLGVDAARGGPPLWRSPWQTMYNVHAATPIVIGSTVFITSGYGSGCSLIGVSDGQAQTVWKSKEYKSHFNAPVLVGEHLYGIAGQADAGGDLTCLDPQTGKALWKQPGFEAGGVVVVDGAIIAVDGKGGDVVMAKLQPTAYQELGRIKPLGGRTWAPPIVADGKLFVKNTQALVCLDLK